MPIDPVAGGEAPSPGVVFRVPYVRFAACVVLVCVSVAVFSLQPWRSAPQLAGVDPSEASGVAPSRPRNVPHDAPGIRTPKTLSANSSGLADSALVVGVRAGGKARAYSIASLARSRSHHIVNDLLGDVPLSVVHCDELNCTRAFTSPARGAPLELAQGGLLDGDMALKSGGRAYRLETLAPYAKEDPPSGLKTHPCEVTTWKKWRSLHPETDVYALP